MSKVQIADTIDVSCIDAPTLMIIAPFVCEGILGEAQGHPYPNGGGVHVHERSAVPSAAQAEHGPQ